MLTGYSRVASYISVWSVVVFARLLVIVTRLLAFAYNLVLCVLTCVFSTSDASLDQWDRRRTTTESFYNEVVNAASVRV